MLLDTCVFHPVPPAEWGHPRQQGTAELVFSCYHPKARCLLIKNDSNSLLCGHSFQTPGSCSVWPGVCVWERCSQEGEEGVTQFPFNFGVVNRAWFCILISAGSQCQRWHFQSLLCHISGKWPVVFVEALESRGREGSLSAVAVCQAQLVLKRGGAEELHYQLKRGVGLAGDRSDWWRGELLWPACPPGYITLLWPGSSLFLFYLHVCSSSSWRWPLQSSKLRPVLALFCIQHLLCTLGMGTFVYE